MLFEQLGLRLTLSKFDNYERLDAYLLRNCYGFKWGSIPIF